MVLESLVSLKLIDVLPQTVGHLTAVEIPLDVLNLMIKEHLGVAHIGC